MINTKDKVADAAASARPYVERALRDQELRDNIRNAYSSARAVYDELASRRKVTDAASRLAGDKDIQNELRNAIDDLRNAADRIQRGPSHKGRNLLLMTGIAVGVLLFNPVSGAETRNWLKEAVLGEDDEFGYQGNSDS